MIFLKCGLVTAAMGFAWGIVAFHNGVSFWSMILGSIAIGAISGIAAAIIYKKELIDD